MLLPRGFPHHKALVADEGSAAVGTKIFDNRSFRLNFEAAQPCKTCRAT
jgi:phosphatidylserine/phosphatidylglycerophosphate/cardiolipin synthase-like enzyme